jgi:phosphatidylserine decarboxylase
MTLPPYFRKYIYLGFGKLYGLNFDEIAIDDINKFKNFNQFFTREIDLSKRPIKDAREINTLCCPCDGKILSFGEVDSLKCTLDCLKGNDYRLDEFLLGY